MNLFEQSVAAVLELPEVTAATRFRETPDWCSLKAFGLLVLLENDWGAPLTVDALRRLETVGDLFLEAFLAFASSVLKVPRARLAGDTAYGSLPEWDSVAHLRLVMESEKRFGTSYPFERVPALRTLADFAAPQS